ncbi:MAG: hypothetical protein IKT86_04155 [Bacteroidaceae bacterium]|nr:hypothetical protein [Bacteroidaceae bacterium]
MLQITQEEDKVSIARCNLQSEPPVINPEDAILQMLMGSLLSSISWPMPRGVSESLYREIPVTENNETGTADLINTRKAIAQSFQLILQYLYCGTAVSV